MKKTRWKPIVFQFIGGFICGAIIGFFVWGGLAIVSVRLFGESRNVIIFTETFGVLLLMPGLALGLGLFLAKCEYRSQLESARLHSHFCKRCNYDLRGAADIVCPECGTGISDKQRNHIQQMLENKPT